MTSNNSSKAIRCPVSVLSASLLVLLSACSQQEAGQAATTASEPSATTAEPLPVAVDAAPASSLEAIASMGPAIPEDLQSSPAQSGGECGIEATATVPQGGVLEFSRARPEFVEGWALYREDSTKPTSVYIKLASDGEASYFAPVTMLSRPGLGIRLGEAAFDGAGFKVTLGLNDVPVGTYTVQVAQRVGDKVLLCATGRTAKVSD